MTTKTELLNNGVVVATRTAAPFYSWDWTPATSGASSLTYKRYEDNVLVFTSAAITGTVDAAAADTTAPTITTATVEDANKDKLVVVFSEVVNITDVTGLTITGDVTPTLSAPTGTGTNTITFTLSAALTTGQSVTLNVAGTNTIEDADANALAVTTKAITNNVAVVGSTTGGTITQITEDGVDYNVHTFIASENLVVTVDLDVEYLVVAGGGGGGAYGAGGAGGVLTNLGGVKLNLSAQTYNIAIGNGGSSTSANSNGGNGSNSIFAGLTAIGGGGGNGGNSNTMAASGGSGGGAGNEGTPGSGTVGQGNDGGLGNYSFAAGGGGGGALASGGSADATGDNAGDGGLGMDSIIKGASISIAGGGGAGGQNTGSGGSASHGGGAGGGANNGVANTGGGGGASRPNSVSGAGGSGIVIIRYAI